MPTRDLVADKCVGKKIMKKIAKLMYRSSAFAIILCMVGCSPEEKIQDDLEDKVEQFKAAHSNYIFKEARTYIYNINGNTNNLADKNVRELAFDYATNIAFSEESKQNFETRQASYYDSLAHAGKDSLQRILPTVNNAPSGGIWVFHEIVYSLYYGSGNFANRRVYLYSCDGEKLIYENDVRFEDYEFANLLRISNTNVSTTAQDDYEIIRGLIIAFIVALIIGLFYWNYKRKEPQRIKKEQEDDEHRRIQEIQRKQATEERWKRWRMELDKRSEEYGELTKQVSIDADEKNSIFIYEATKTIFIKNKKYSFSDILSCNVEQVLFKKGTETHVTTPDKIEMASEQALWGLGKKYNVKTTTVVTTTPDQYKYVVYIGIRSISDPQIQISFDKQTKANEIKNLMIAIMEISKQEG